MVLNCTIFSFDCLAYFWQIDIFQYISNMSGWLALLRSPQFKTELLLQLLHTSESFQLSHLQQNVHKYSGYGLCYGVAFFLQIGVFVLQRFFRGRAILEVDDSVSSQCAKLRKNNTFSEVYEQETNGSEETYIDNRKTLFH